MGLKKKEGSLKGHKDDISTLKLNKEGNILYTGSVDKKIKIWNIE